MRRSCSFPKPCASWRLGERAPACVATGPWLNLWTDCVRLDCPGLRCNGSKLDAGTPLTQSRRAGVNHLLEVAWLSCSRLCGGDFFERGPCCDLPDVPCSCDDPVRCGGGGEHEVCEASCLSVGRGCYRAVDLSRLAVDRAFAGRSQDRPRHRRTVRILLGADASASIEERGLGRL
jgi:hypothetical protein